MKKLWFVFGVFLIGAVAPVSAELPDRARNNFPEIIKDYCHSYLDYSLEDPIGEWTEEEGWTGQAQEFHKTIGCIFDSALVAVIKNEKEIIENGFKYKEEDGEEVSDEGISGLSIDEFSITGECPPLFYTTVQSGQRDKGFQSKCKDQLDIAEINQEFSACYITETVLQEWCGYDLFLSAKTQDEESFLKQEGDLGISTSDTRIFPFVTAQEKMEEERSRVEQSVSETLLWYQELEQASRQSAWLMAIEKRLDTIKTAWIEIRSALGTFVDKFLNAST